MIEQYGPLTDRGRSRPAGGPIRKIILGKTPVLPVLVTLCNGVAGLLAIHYATKDGLGQLSTRHLAVAAWLLFVGMFFDALDGRVARMTRQATDFGAQLDSLCDAISFGVAPAVLMVHAVSRTKEISDFDLFETHPSLGKVIMAIAVIYTCCALLRLARFNVENAPDLLRHMGFKGLPSPAAAALVAALVLAFDMLLKFDQGEWLKVTVGIALPSLTLAAALLMVSRLPYPHLLNRFIVRKKSFGTIVSIVILLASAIMFPRPSLAFGAVIFAALGPATALYHKFRPASPQETEPLDS